MNSYYRLVLLFLVFSFANLGTADAALSTNMSVGSKGQQVKELQLALTKLGFYAGPITGNYGPMTKNAVAKFQKANKISPPNGVTSLITRNKINLSFGASNPVTSKPKVAIPVIAVQTQTVQSFSLKSNFLRDDATAQAIASGKISNYDIKTYTANYGALGPFSTDNFAYKFFSALRMLGHIKEDLTVGGQYPAEKFLNRAQRFSNLPTSSLIDINILKVVDSMLVNRENFDRDLAVKFPLYNHFVNPPLNEPTREHDSAMLAAIFNELPSHLVIWSETNFKDFFSRQMSGHIKNLDNSDYQFCDTGMYPELGMNCATGVYFGTPLINKTSGVIQDDFEISSTIIHEYAHYLDRKLYNQESGMSKGLIDTTDFYNISYDTSDPAPNGVREFAYRRPSNIQNEFVSEYAQGWKRSVNGKDYYSAAEDFAESFAMYVTEGKVFRQLAETNNVLKQKYNWLETNVFNGQEYQSGDIQSITILPLHAKGNSRDLAKQSTGAFNQIDYVQSLPNFVWNYKFISGSLVSKP